MVNWTDVVR